MSAIAEPTAPGIDDVEPCEHETRDRIITGTVTVLPVLCLLIVAWQVWGEWLGWNDIFVFLIMYVLTGLGITVGFHRMLTHRAFKTTPFVRGVFTALGSAAIEGPVISWVADHRKHHAFSDRPGDPHSPHVDHGSGWRGALQAASSTRTSAGCSCTRTAAAARRYAPDLIADPVVSAIDRSASCSASPAASLAPFLLGWAFGGTLRDGFTGMLWGGAVRVLVLHHSTYSINSLCHFFGRRRFDDEGRVAQPVLARSVHVRRGVAQQPPRVPDVGRARHAPLGVRSVGLGHLGAREGSGSPGTSCGSRASEQAKKLAEAA